MTDRRAIAVQQRRGVALPPHTRSVARPSRFGNPFRCASDPASRAAAVAQYREWLDGHHPDVLGPAGGLTGPMVKDLARRELAGWDLACYCPLDGPCHRLVLLELCT
ncbi:DUF4326 domain-containing protein [Actinophytocola sp.]|uniref:DUF4326 domain-containing protein n=1 Tax=Actinophytocola sp. TaxID=1872138 RepID=UPI002ED41EF2